MKRKGLIFLPLILILFISCDNSYEDKGLQFSLKNQTSIDIKDIKVLLPDTLLEFEALKSNSFTKTINVSSAYRYGFLEFKDKNNTRYTFNPTDFVGEELYTEGNITFVIIKIDTATKWVNLGAIGSF